MPIDAVMISAGKRATFAYGPYALQHPDEIRVVAVAEPDAARRAFFAAQHDIPPERQFASWEELAARPRLARAAINCTQDREHVASATALMRAGYDMLLEKPMAGTPEACARLVIEAEATGRMLQICHVLRFTEFFRALRDIVQSGRLGRIITVDHRENVAFWHMAHSFVRGHWGIAAASSPMILAKCCHDLDILTWALGKGVRRLSSFGALTHYRAENAPEGAPGRCTDGCPAEAECPWHAPRLYAATEPIAFSRAFMLQALEGGDTPAERHEALKTSPYGRCVYRCGNDVVDHQVITLDCEDDVTATFTMHGHSDREGRTMRWDGTRATLYGDFSDGRPHELRIVDHGGAEDVIHPGAGGSGHAGGDFGLMRDFVRALNGQPTEAQTTARASLHSHLLAFAAEASRLSGQTIDFADYASRTSKMASTSTA